MSNGDTPPQRTRPPDKEPDARTDAEKHAAKLKEAKNRVAELKTYEKKVEGHHFSKAWSSKLRLAIAPIEVNVLQNRLPRDKQWTAVKEVKERIDKAIRAKEILNDAKKTFENAKNKAGIKKEFKEGLSQAIKKLEDLITGERIPSIRDIKFAIIETELAVGSVEALRLDSIPEKKETIHLGKRSALAIRLVDSAMHFEDGTKIPPRLRGKIFPILDASVNSRGDERFRIDAPLGETDPSLLKYFPKWITEKSPRTGDRNYVLPGVVANASQLRNHLVSTRKYGDAFEEYVTAREQHRQPDLSNFERDRDAYLSTFNRLFLTKKKDIDTRIQNTILESGVLDITRGDTLAHPIAEMRRLLTEIRDKEKIITESLDMLERGKMGNVLQRIDDKGQKQTVIFFYVISLL